MNLDKYKALDKSTNINKEKVRLYAECLNDALKLKRDLSQLEQLIRDNSDECSKFVWQGNKGAISIFDVDDDYLKNIIRFCERHDRNVPKEIVKLYTSKFPELPLPSDGYDDDGDDNTPF